MKRGLFVAVAMVCGLLLAPMSAPPAAAAPVGKIDLQAKATDTGVIQVRKGGGRGGFRGGRGGFRGGFKGGGRGGFKGGHRGGFRGGYRGGGRKFGRGGRGHHHRRHRRGGRSFYYAAPYLPYYYADDFYYNDSCEWLRRRALSTGKSYWWRRYDRCING